jgi:hypothetical protein
MYTLTWTAQAAITEQRTSDLLSEAAACRLARQAPGQGGRHRPALTDLCRVPGRRLAGGLRSRRPTVHRRAARAHAANEAAVTEPVDRTRATAPAGSGTVRRVGAQRAR